MPRIGRTVNTCVYRGTNETNADTPTSDSVRISWYGGILTHPTNPTSPANKLQSWIYGCRFFESTAGTGWGARFYGGFRRNI